MIKISMTKISIPSPRPSPQWGEGKGEGCFGNLKLELRICLGFGIWNLGFLADTTFLGVDSIGSVIQNE
jgi:hypothetical protein